ncbi:MAG TPA: hypothetical protein VFV02_11435 [Acidimicrobiales bacterium]|nr:hypothetical protein [Acidimicrobiales bacterium]
MTALVVGLTVAVALLALLVAGLLRAHAEVLKTLHQMGVNLDPSAPAGDVGPQPIGPPVPGSGGPGLVGTAGTVAGPRPTPGRPDRSDLADIIGSTPRGDALTVAVAGVAHDTLLAFLTSGCATCRGFWDAFRGDPPDVPGGARLVAVTRGSEAESPGAILGLTGAGGPGTSLIPVIMSTSAWEHYDIPYAPYFVYVSGAAGRVVGEGVASTWEQVRALVANAVADGTTNPGRRRSRADRERDSEVDRALAEAGIRPGDPRLYPEPIRPPAEPATPER